MDGSQPFPECPDTLPVESDGPREVPDDHALRTLFREAARHAFERYRALHDPAIEEHICEEVLGDFVHMDRIYRLHDREGQRLTDLASMAQQPREDAAASGLERDLEVHQHVGDYALFIAGLFPEFIARYENRPDLPLLVCVGSTVVALQEPVTYYIVEGRSAYSHVSRLYKVFDSTRSGVFHRLSMRFEEYLGVMRDIRDYIRQRPEMEDVQGIIA